MLRNPSSIPATSAGVIDAPAESISRAVDSPRHFPALVHEMQQADALLRSRSPSFINKHIERYKSMHAAQDTLFETLGEISAFIDRTALGRGWYDTNAMLARQECETRLRQFMVQLEIDPDTASLQDIKTLVKESKAKITYLHLPDLHHIGRVIGSKVLPGSLKPLMADNDMFDMPTMSEECYWVKGDFADKAARRKNAQVYRAALDHFLQGAEKIRIAHPLNPVSTAE